ncbi:MULTISPECIES: RusA family crossover junction endodeoxyribonuclease [Bacillus cereus group]|nr:MULTISPECIES: RusA family crossover junction endodeoxyribonuclease [Bacillus cereus group]
MMELHLELPLAISINKLYMNQYQWNPKTRKKEPTGKRILTKEGLGRKMRIIKAAKQQMKGQEWDYEFTKTNYVYMDCVFYFAKRGTDDNNQYKLLCDALEKIVYENDSRVLVRTQRILYDTKNPRVSVRFRPVKYIGIFSNEESLESFKERCVGCSHYRKGSCSVLKTAIKGNIQEELNERTLECNKWTERKTKSKK